MQYLLVEVLVEKRVVFLNHELLNWMHVLVQYQVIISGSVLNIKSIDA